MTQTKRQKQPSHLQLTPLRAAQSTPPSYTKLFNIYTLSQTSSTLHAISQHHPSSKPSDSLCLPSSCSASWCSLLSASWSHRMQPRHRCSSCPNRGRSRGGWGQSWRHAGAQWSCRDRKLRMSVWLWHFGRDVGGVSIHVWKQRLLRGWKGKGAPRRWWRVWKAYFQNGNVTRQLLMT